MPPGPAPSKTRRRRNAPAHGEWQPSPGSGWQHGPIPEPADGLLAVSRETWQTWFQAWFASHWTPADLPGLRLLITQYDAIQRSGVKANDVTALVRLMDNYGITPAGQQSRRWEAPKGDPEEKPAATPETSPYGHLRAV